MIYKQFVVKYNKPIIVGTYGKDIPIYKKEPRVYYIVNDNRQRIIKSGSGSQIAICPDLNRGRLIYWKHLDSEENTFYLQYGEIPEWMYEILPKYCVKKIKEVREKY